LKPIRVSNNAEDTLNNIKLGLIMVSTDELKHVYLNYIKETSEIVNVADSSEKDGNTGNNEFMFPLSEESYFLNISA